MANIWKHVKHILTHSFSSGQNPIYAGSVPGGSPLPIPRSYCNLLNQIDSVNEEIFKLKQTIRLSPQPKEPTLIVDIWRKLIRARDLRYKIGLLQSELQRSFSEQTKPDHKRKEPQTTVDLDRVIQKETEQVLASEKFRNHPKRAGFQKAATDLCGPDPTCRRNAVRLLRDLYLPESLTLLRAALAYRDDALRIACLRALTDYGYPETLSDFEPFLDSPNYRLRIEALRGIYQLGGYAATMACLRCLLDTSPELRRTAVTLLGWQNSSITVQVLTILLRDENPFVRQSTAEILGTLGSEQAVYILIRTLEDPEIPVRIAARDALTRILSIPIDLDVENDFECLSPEIAELLQWWSQARVKGPPWGIPRFSPRKSNSDVLPLMAEKYQLNVYSGSNRNLTNKQYFQDMKRKTANTGTQQPSA